MTSNATTTEPRKTPLYATHVRHGGKMVDFAGWCMPIQYGTGQLAEHHAVRQRAGLFDVSHMGELRVRGPDAVAAVNRLVSNDLAAIPAGKAQYTCFPNDQGTLLDDAICYVLAPDDVLIVVNASNAAKMAAWVTSRITGDVTAVDESDHWALLAIQGPLSRGVLARVLPETEAMGAFAVRRCGSLIVATTGYTGEPGAELFVPAGEAAALWDALMLAGEADGLVPVGLAARDTLRLELKLALYGNDIDETTNPLEAGLGWVTKLDKPGGFIGQDALRAIKTRGLTRRLVGLEMTDRGIARHGYPVLAAGGERIGTVTSGTQSPTLQKAIAMAYIDLPHEALGTVVYVEIRGKPTAAIVVKTPFYNKEKAK